jgi:hypothetical protein
VAVPVGPGLKAKQLDVVASKQHIRVGVKGQEPILDVSGEAGRGVQPKGGGGAGAGTHCGSKQCQQSAMLCSLCIGNSNGTTGVQAGSSRNGGSSITCWWWHLNSICSSAAITPPLCTMVPDCAAPHDKAV